MFPLIEYFSTLANFEVLTVPKKHAFKWQDGALGQKLGNSVLQEMLCDFHGMPSLVAAHVFVVVRKR
jgi:hypothetical protein